jgi:hypothetical protein
VLLCRRPRNKLFEGKVFFKHTVLSQTLSCTSCPRASHQALRPRTLAGVTNESVDCLLGLPARQVPPRRSNPLARTLAPARRLRSRVLDLTALWLEPGFNGVLPPKGRATCGAAGRRGRAAGRRGSEHGFCGLPHYQSPLSVLTLVSRLRYSAVYRSRI